MKNKWNALLLYYLIFKKKSRADGIYKKTDKSVYN